MNTLHLDLKQLKQKYADLKARWDRRERTDLDSPEKQQLNVLAKRIKELEDKINPPQINQPPQHINKIGFHWRPNEESLAKAKELIQGTEFELLELPNGKYKLSAPATPENKDLLKTIVSQVYG